ncbi:hypothetical protein [Cellulomonas carbonis]|uniref:hypothetical protein n=1 Tax=Cellulomonas carbonis TaxID=1386092 RepID=UPI00126A4B51|nr:hypothetical protein [Cellulomonas carbonis]
MPMSPSTTTLEDTVKVIGDTWSATAPGARDADLARTLDPLTRYGWTLLHGLDRPGRPPASIDHVAVGPGGVAVIAAVPRPHAPADLLAPTDDVQAVARAAAEVTALLAPQHRRTVSALVHVPSLTRGPAAMLHGVRVVGPHLLVPHLLSLPERLDPAEVDELAQQLRDRLAGPATQVAPRRIGRRRPSVVRELVRYVSVVAATWGVITYVLP